MEKMVLTEKEERGLRVGKIGGEKSLSKEPQAVVKVMSDRPVRADALEAALGKVWCPIKGIACKDLGDNHFLFTFFQAAGKKRALEDGPWSFGKDVVVVVDFDGSKRVDEMKFTDIPIWVRVLKMPLGTMTREYGKAIGNHVGRFVEMESEDGELAVGQFLRIKVRLDITKPLMRGIKLNVEADGKEKDLWCPFKFLPDFCYICGIIGHVERDCEVTPVQGARRQYNSQLRYIPERRKGGIDGVGREGYTHSKLPWRTGVAGSKGSWSGGSSGGSEDARWRKSENSGDGGLVKGKEDKEVTSPLKLLNQSTPSNQAAPKKKLAFDAAASGGNKGEEGKNIVSEMVNVVATTETDHSKGEVAAAQNMEEDGKGKSSEVSAREEEPSNLKDVSKEQGGSKFKRIPRNKPKQVAEKESSRKVGEKRSLGDVGEDMDVDTLGLERKQKKQVTEGTSHTDDAGPAFRSCGAQ